MKTRPLLLSCCLALSATAQTIVIDGLQANGSLTWNGDATNFSRYHIEWSPTVAGPWSASWSGLTNLVSTNGTMTVAVPMFYRVVGRLVPPAGESCENAPTNAPGSYSDTTVGYANDYNAAAQSTPSPGRDRVYRVSVPANRILNVTMTPANTPLLDAVLLLLSGSVSCAEAASNLLATADASGAGAAETVSWTNATSLPIDVLVVADSFTAEPAGDYELTLNLISTLAGDVCETAAILSPGNLTDLTTVGYADDRGAGSGCAAAAGPDRFFRISIPVGQTLTATVAPSSAWDAVVNLVSAAQDCPAPAACLAGEDVAGVGGLEAVEYTNNTGEILDVFIVVGGFGAADAGTFNLTTTVSP